MTASLVVFSMILTGFGMFMGPFDPGTAAMPSRSVPALNGEGLLEDLAYVTITGEDFPGPGGNFGDYIWTGDINDDGIEDLAIASTRAPGTVDTGNSNVGYVYVWYGGSAVMGRDLDLGVDEPDLLIRGGHEYSYLLESMDVGYLNDDEYIDLVLGVRDHPECGRVFVIWGKPGGWPSVIDLYDPGRLSPNGDPYGFIRNQDYFIVGGHLSPVPWPEANYDTGDCVVAEDLDLDGRDDLVFSSPGWHHVIILWGKDSKNDLGTEMTIIDDQEEGARFGESVNTGDIDGDGRPDLVISAPLRTEEGTSRYQSGAVFVIYNASRMRGQSEIDNMEVSHPVIWGEGSYDKIGLRTMMVDIDHDGKDEIIIGAPFSDGPSNTRSGCGGIFIYKGGDINQFPLRMGAEVDADIVIHGEKGEKKDFPGDHLGTAFDIGDLDGDPGLELVIGSPKRPNDNDEPVGTIIGYETRDVFTYPSNIVDLANSPKRFQFFGKQWDDNAGFTIGFGNVNNDSAGDLICGMTGSDGPGDLRSNCGQAFYFPGSSISIDEITVQGPGVFSGKILPNYAPFNLNLTLRHSQDAGEINRIEVVFEPDLLDISMVYDNGSLTMTDPFGIFEVDRGASKYTVNGAFGKLSLRMNISWFSNMGRPWDILVVARSSSFDIVERGFFPSALKLNNEVRLLETFNAVSSGSELNNMNDWLPPGSTVTYDSFRIVYERTSGLKVPPGDFLIEMNVDGEKESEEPYSGPATSLDLQLPGQSSLYEITFSAVLAGEPPQWQGRPFGPLIVGIATSEVKVDASDPNPPEDVTFLPDGEPGTYDDDRDWGVVWLESVGSSLDEGGSGVRHFTCSIDGGEGFVPKSSGGLFSTYYGDSEFGAVVREMERIDGKVDFSWGSWGPDINYLEANRFSVRWHGWFSPDESRLHTLMIKGNGMAKLILDGEVLVRWSDISTPTYSSPVFINSGDAKEIVLYYYNYDPTGIPSSSISLQYQDNEGTMTPIPAQNLLFPCNSTEFMVPGSEDFELAVRSVDWVGRSSLPRISKGYIDSRDPVIDISGIEPWYNTSSPVFPLKIYDPAGEGFGSGIDLGTLLYRTKETSESSYSQWMKVDGEILERIEGIDGPGYIEFLQSAILTETWKGSIQWRVSDVVDNDHETSILDIGVDRISPQFIVLSPNLEIKQKEGQVEVVVKITDIAGSGVESGSVEWRSRSGAGYSDWRAITGEVGNGEEVVISITVPVIVGENHFQVRARDKVDNLGISPEFRIIGEERIVDQKPVAIIDLPLNDTRIIDGTPLTLDASSSYDDGMGAYPELKFTWISNIDSYLGSGMRLDNVYLNSLGEHRIRVYVDDGTPGHNVSADVYVEVVRRNTSDIDDDVVDDDSTPGKSMDYLTPIIFLLVLMVIIGVVLWLLLRRRKVMEEEEIRLDYVEKTEDDYEYEERTLEEEKELGIHLEDKEMSGKELEKERKKLYEEP
ncbi:MAG: FG-GAP-like repeat-containing protein [Thermoplasmatota archaeon]